MADNNFETNMHRQMEDLKISPSGEVWQKVEEQLQKDKRRRRWFFIWLPLIALTFGTGWFVLKNQSPQTQFVTTKKAIVAEKNTKELQSSLTTIKKIETKSEAVKNNTVIEKKQSTEKLNLVSHKNNFNSALQTDKRKFEKLTFQTKNDEVIAQVQEQPNTKKPFIQNLSNGKSDTVITIHVAPQLVFKSETDTAYAIVQTSADKIYDDSLMRAKVQIKDSSVSEKKADATKTKWQFGLKVNGGIADIRTSPFPKSGFRSESNSYSISNGVQVSAQPGSIVTEYAIKKNIQFGFGVVLRKKIGINTFFVTGLQYQFNSYTVKEQQKGDSISQPSNTLVRFINFKTTTNYRNHFITIPTEVQMQLIKAPKGSFTLSSGIHHFIHIGSSNSMNNSRLPSFLSIRPPGNFQSYTSPAFYQSVFHLAPAYEWKKQKNTKQLGWYIHYGITPMYTSGKYHLWQTGLRFQYYFSK